LAERVRAQWPGRWRALPCGQREEKEILGWFGDWDLLEPRLVPLRGRPDDEISGRK
jgi:hypothetical protein